MTTYDLDLPLARTGKGQVAPGPPLHANQRLHWRAERTAKKLVRDTAHWRALDAKIPPAQHITVQVHYLPGDNRRRDPSNLMPTQKAAVDGIVRAGVVPDDSPEYVTELMPTIHTGPSDRRLWLRITTRKDTPQ
ncbi:hypothetical protein [Actinokineospora globicatena]|uniref:Uncharacterized protein n=1 Tax=Actinokineospora globicatena TaxID=103729 RepID=A0A9W6V9B5_9PSEU|nr:hypothetical protein [Actinokineospora globicatena]GLW91804.1 hypothetical protein Aglo03_26200 [Actinokineospora globicatena]